MTTEEVFSALSGEVSPDTTSNAQTSTALTWCLASAGVRFRSFFKQWIVMREMLAFLSLFLIGLAGLPASSLAQNNVGIGTTTPNASSILDLTSSSLGFLVPRMSTANRNSIPSPAIGLLVYDTNFETFYYFNGTIWLPFLGWSLTGNASTNPTVNFLGTTDGQPLIIKTNGAEDLRFTPSGLIGVGITTPTQKFEVSGDIKIDTALGAASQLQFENPAGSFVTSFQAGAQTSNIGYVLPTLQGVANSVLGNNGSGVLSWVLTSNYDWSLTGNTGTNPSINFLGTADATDFVFRTNNTEYMRLTSGGFFGIGTSTPTQKIDVRGNILIDTIGGTASQLQFLNPAGTFITSFKAGAQSTNVSYTLPLAQGAANTVLTNNGSGTLSWAVPGSSYDWTLLGNSGTVDGTNFLGTTDNVALTLRANNLQALRIEPNINSPNLIGGYNGNNAVSGVYGSVIGGGGSNGSANSVTTDYDFIGGGVGNTAGDNGGSTSEAKYVVIGGGSGNSATGAASSILGGQFHVAGGRYSSILGGVGDETYGFSQSVVGQYNDPFPTTPCGCLSNSFLYPAFIVGGGTSSSSRYNSMTVDFKGILELGEEGSNSTFSAIPELRISGSTSGYVGFRAAAVTTSHHYVMPAAQGSANTVLTNDGSGNLSWSVAGSGTPQRYAVQTVSSFSANQNNLILDTTKSIFRISCSPPVTVTGLADTSNGRYVILTNVGTTTITVTNQDGGSSTYNRIITGSGASITLLADKSLTLYYDGTTQRWRVVSTTP